MSGETRQVILKGAGWSALAIILFLAYLLSKTAHNKATKNMLGRLELTRQRHQNCETQRRMLTGQYKQKEEDELSLAQSDRAALRQENELLTQDNEELKAENDALEKEIDEMKEQLDQKDFVTDDEIEALEETMALGNNSQALTDLLEDVQVSGDLQKDQLLETLVNELKKKTVAYTQCMRRKYPPPPTWSSLNADEKTEELGKVVLQLARLGNSDMQRVGELVATWGPRYPGGVDGLKKAVKKRIAELFVEDSETPKKATDEEEEPTKKKKKTVVIEEDETPKKKAAAASGEEAVKKVKKPVADDEEEIVIVKKKKKVVVEEDEEPKAATKKRVQSPDDDEVVVKSKKRAD